MSFFGVFYVYKTTFFVFDVSKWKFVFSFWVFSTSLSLSLFLSLSLSSVLVFQCWNDWETALRYVFKRCFCSTNLKLFRFFILAGVYAYKPPIFVLGVFYNRNNTFLFWVFSTFMNHPFWFWEFSKLAIWFLVFGVFQLFQFVCILCI